MLNGPHHSDWLLGGKAPLTAGQAHSTMGVFTCTIIDFSVVAKRLTDLLSIRRTRTYEGFVSSYYVL